MRTSLIPIVLLFAACAPLDDDEPSVDETSAPLISGTSTSARPEIGQIATPIGTCTATLIGTRYVLTAAHCVGLSAGNSMTFWFVDKTGVARPYPTMRVQKFTREILQNLLGDPIFSTDVALLQLASPVPSSQADPARVSMNAPTTGTQVTLFGYGCQNRANGSGGGFKQYFSFLFRQPASNNSCPGDSGGPGVFGNVGDNGAVWSVTQGYTSSYDLLGNVSFFKPQIEEMMRTWDGELEIGMNRSGMDYSTIASSSATACRATCTADARCRSFAYFAPWGICYLKDGVPDMAPAVNFTSGVAPVQETAIDRPGMDYASWVPPQPRAELCAAACARDPLTCRAWTYVQGGSCWLKSAIPAAQSCSYCTSGVTDRSVEPGYGRNGGDYLQLTASSARGCAALCSQDERCRSFTWNRNTCTLKNIVGNGSAVADSDKPVVASGVRRGLDVNVTRPGGDYWTFTQTTASPYECQARCARESQCVAWQIDLAPDGTIANPTCRLKSSIPAASTAFGSISGLKGLELVP